MASADYQVAAAAPVLSPGAGSYSATQSVVVTNPQTGVDMRYTVSGADPAQTDPVIGSGGTITVDATETLKVAAWKTGFTRSATTTAAYTLTPATPTYSAAGGTYTTPQSITIVSSTAQTTIRFTLDGTTPTATSAAYTTPLFITSSTTVKAAAFRTGWTPSAIASATYTMNIAPLEALVIAPAGGTFTTTA